MTGSFSPLDAESRRGIAKKLLAEFTAQAQRAGCSLTLEGDMVEYLLARWQRDGYGVRTLKRILERELGNPVAKALAEGKRTLCLRRSPEGIGQN